ncbi:beta-phosphoglucomutase [Neobacillus notoginsengisoli]|uniref:Beta-phosphoglucomutase n=1 Tax=Neobacillus notoginsengisoli TaxID=1578198 RepID=A0A417YIL0_9BACI|nr:beta-phosphoglucomutase [Neobacillus notoginsengisoli]RHW32832.1 beta-phosphoglucomutase [Neobacillus notoginsengisoli]
MGEMVKAVIFDLDGVIVDTAEWHYFAWKDLANSIGIDFSREFNEELKGISRMGSLEKILEHGGVAGKYSDEEKIELATVKNTNYVQLLTQMKPDDILPGIREFLEQLKDNNIKIGLASASKNAPAILDYLKLTDYFETVINPDEVAKGKPAPDIFLRAAENLSVPPSECIGIEDATAGIQAIKEAGMFAVGVGTKEVMVEAGADLVLESTTELDLKSIKREFLQKE